MQDYKMLRVKSETYKQLKQLALDFDIPLTKLIDKLLEEHQKLNAKIAGGIRVNVKLNDKRQISYISNYEANATVVMDE